MKYNLKNIGKALVVAGAIAFAATGKGCYERGKKIEGLETKLSSAQLEINKLFYDQLNPAPWNLKYDDLTGEPYFERLNGDAIGNVWTEYRSR